MAQLDYKEYKRMATKYLDEQVEKMERIINGSDEEFDGRFVSIFARQGNITYPDPSKVANLVAEMRTTWQGICSKKVELQQFTVVFESQPGRGGFPQVMIQIYKP